MHLHGLKATLNRKEEGIFGMEIIIQTKTKEMREAIIPTLDQSHKICVCIRLQVHCMCAYVCMCAYLCICVDMCAYVYIVPDPFVIIAKRTIRRIHPGHDFERLFKNSDCVY